MHFSIQQKAVLLKLSINFFNMSYLHVQRFRLNPLTHFLNSFLGKNNLNVIVNEKDGSMQKSLYSKLKNRVSSISTNL